MILQILVLFKYRILNAVSLIFCLNKHNEDALRKSRGAKRPEKSNNDLNYLPEGITFKNDYHGKILDMFNK